MAVTGATGLIGSALLSAFSARGYDTFRVTRSRNSPRASDIYWNPDTAELNAEALEGMDVVIHLAGENVAQRWTAAQRKRIIDSRVRGTRLLAETLAGLARPPATFISASAIGYYGVSADAPIDESGAPGHDFLATVVQQWEAAANPARDTGIRVVHPRIGLVLSRRGGALARMLPFFRFGLGGRLGSGRQWMSWISMRDLTRAVQHIIDTSQIRDVVNLVAPNPVQNGEFAKTLGKVLHRPSIFPVPRFALKLLYGEMADGTVLASQRVVARVLTDSGFVFEHARLEDALRYELRNPEPESGA